MASTRAALFLDSQLIDSEKELERVHKPLAIWRNELTGVELVEVDSTDLVDRLRELSLSVCTTLL